MEKQEVRAVTKYFYFSARTDAKSDSYVKKTSEESAVAYSTVTK